MRTDVASKRPRLTAAARSEQLLDVAEERFMAQGFDRTTIEDVARAAGVSRPIVYQHHGSKEGLYLACVARARAQLLHEYAAAVGERTEPAEVLRAAAEAWFTVVARDRARWTLLFGTSVPLPPALAAGVEAQRGRNLGYYVAAVQRWVRPDVPAAQAAAVAQMISGTGGQLAEWWLVNPDVTQDAVVGYYTDFCLNGLAPLLPGAPRA